MSGQTPDSLFRLLTRQFRIGLGATRATSSHLNLAASGDNDQGNEGVVEGCN